MRRAWASSVRPAIRRAVPSRWRWRTGRAGGARGGAAYAASLRGFHAVGRGRAVALTLGGLAMVAGAEGRWERALRLAAAATAAGVGSPRPRCHRSQARQYRMIDYGSGQLTVRAIKTADRRRARLARRVAARAVLRQAGSAGLDTTQDRRDRETAELAIQHGYQLCVHAIGDRANRETLEHLRAAFKANPDKKDCAGASSTRSTSARRTSRASASWA